MPQANDAELTELYTAATGEEVQDNEPNTGPPGQPPATAFDLRLQAVAGSVIGNAGGTYELRIDCIDDTLAQRNGSMSVAAQNQRFNNAAGNDWVLAGGTAGNFVKEQTFPITVDNGAKGHVLHYVATMVNASGDIVSFLDSPQFILV
jgi:hypothetical protein